ncbi:MAG: DUF739 family protein [Ruminococcaceae bacterium]|nr:DUF739 family protein [Oscillospiraceae bacterium]
MKEKYDYKRLKGRIKEVCGTQKEFSKQMNLSNQSVSKKLNNVVEFTQDEIMDAVKVLSIPGESITDYFFCTKV